MTPLWPARAGVLTAAMTAVSPCWAGVWGAEPLLGLVGDYSTNPTLLTATQSAEIHGALLLDAPTTYQGDAFVFSVLPRFRIGDSPGYSSVTSNYAHLDVKGEWDRELGTVTASGGISRDSSLYYDYVLNGAAGVQRDGANADVDWKRQLSERTVIDTEVTSSHVRYGESVGTATLTDYSYTNFTPTFAWDVTQAGKLTASGSVGLYKSTDGKTKSTNANLELGFLRHLNELWTVNADAGYSRAYDKIETSREVLVFTPNGIFIELVPLTVKSQQNGSVFSLNATRQSSRLTLSATASRQLMPSGFAFLSRQQVYEVTTNYSLTARATLNADVRFVKSEDPSQSGIFTNRTLKYAALSWTWLWTEKWKVTVSGSRVMEDIQAIHATPSSSELRIELSRQFNRIKF